MQVNNLNNYNCNTLIRRSIKRCFPYVRYFQTASNSIATVHLGMQLLTVYKYLLCSYKAVLGLDGSRSSQFSVLASRYTSKARFRSPSTSSSVRAEVVRIPEVFGDSSRATRSVIRPCIKFNTRTGKNNKM